MKTKFASYCSKGIAEGCKYCVKGQKLVLFITGKCSRKCWYCSLSNKRKNVEKVWANEKDCLSIKDVIKEVEFSNAKGAGITGGDPLIVFGRTLRFASALKKRFGKKFHIHIYLPTKLVSSEKLKKLSKVVDEVRFHPSLLLENKDFDKDISKINLASKFWDKKNIGIEMPMIPDKKKEILNFILSIKDKIGFVNLNELEISDTNFDLITNKYKINQDSYTIKGSKEAGLWILKKINNKLKAHLCTARTKNLFQYKNRLRLRKIFPYQYFTKEGSIIYFFSYTNEKISKKNYYFDNEKNRFIINPKNINKLKGKIRIFRVEELPTSDRIELQLEEI